MERLEARKKEGFSLIKCVQMQANGLIFYSNKHINGLAVMWSLKSLGKRKKNSL